MKPGDDTWGFLILFCLLEDVSFYHQIRSNSLLSRASLVAQLVNPPAMQETPVRFMNQEALLEKG